MALAEKAEAMAAVSKFGYRMENNAEWTSATTWEYRMHPRQYVLGGGTLFLTYRNYLTCLHPLYTRGQVIAAAFQDLLFSPADNYHSMSYVTYSNVILVVWCLFITEEFQSTAWVSTTIKIATGHIVSFAPIFIGIVVAAAVLLVARFGNYFWQFP